MVTPNKENIHPIKLSIQVSPNGLSFCGLDGPERKIIFFRDIQFEKKLNPVDILHKIEEVYHQEEFLQKEKPEVCVLYSNELYTVVPESLFDADQASDYLKFNTKILKTDYIAHDLSRELGIVTVFIPYANVNNFFFERYGEFEYRHAISVFIENCIHESQKFDHEINLYVNYYSERFDLVVVKNGSLILANTFDCQTEQDFLYYLLFTAEQLDLDPEIFNLLLMGRLLPDSDHYQLASRYIRNISFLDCTFGFVFADNQDPPRGSEHYTLLKTF